MQVQPSLLAMVLALASMPLMATDRAGALVGPTDRNGTAAASQGGAPRASAAGTALDAASSERMRKLHTEYMRALFDDMRTSPNPEQRLLSVLLDKILVDEGFSIDGEDSGRKATADEVAALAEANPGNLKMQWMIAASGDPRVSEDTKAGAIARLQFAENDNAAVWAFALPIKGEGAAEAVEGTLRRIAQSTRYDVHTLYSANAMLEAMAHRPIPDELIALWTIEGMPLPVSPDLSAKIMALAIAAANTSTVGVGIVHACAQGQSTAATPSRREACIAAARTMLATSTSMMDLRFGESILRKLDALDAPSAERARNATWWHEQSTAAAMAGDVSGFLDDYFASGNEVDAMRRNAERLGKARPPANWTSPNER